MANVNDLDMSDADEMREGFEPIPPGEYVLYMEESERKNTKANDGAYLNCTFVVAEGEYQNRKIFHMFNLWNKSADSRKGAKADWKAVCEVTVNLPNAPGGESENIHFKKFLGTLSIEPASADGKWPAKNKLVFRKGSIRPLGGSQTTLQTSTGQVQPTQQQPVQTAGVAQAASAAVASRPAWAKK